MSTKRSGSGGGEPHKKVRGVAIMAGGTIRFEFPNDSVLDKLQVMIGGNQRLVRIKTVTEPVRKVRVSLKRYKLISVVRNGISLGFKVSSDRSLWKLGQICGGTLRNIQDKSIADAFESVVDGGGYKVEKPKKVVYIVNNVDCFDRVYQLNSNRSFNKLLKMEAAQYIRSIEDDSVPTNFESLVHHGRYTTKRNVSVVPEIDD